MTPEQNQPNLNNTNSDNPFLAYFKRSEKSFAPNPLINEKELLEDFEEIAARKKKGVRALLLLPLAVFTGFIPILPFVLVVIAIVIFFKSTRNNKGSHGYTVGDYKKFIVYKALSPIVENFAYEEKIGVPESAVENLDITKMGNRFKSEDYITGKYHGVYFAQSDIDIWQSEDDKTTTYFLGRWIDIKYPKPFTGMVTIVDRKYEYKVKKHRYLEPVTLENPDFNNTFIVESNSQQVAYYLLTPQIMEKLLYIRQHSQGEIIACFMDGYLHVGINNFENAFEPNTSKLDIQGDIEKAKFDFTLVSGFIELLSIDRNVYVESQNTQMPQQAPNNFAVQQNVQQTNNINNDNR